MTESFLIFPDPAPPEVVRQLDFDGYQWRAIAGVDQLVGAEPEDGWTGAIVDITSDADKAWALCRELRRRDVPVEPLLILASGSQLDDLAEFDELFDEFMVTPFHSKELEARVRHLLWKAGRGARPELVTYGDLVLNLETYQAVLGTRPLDLTYMEYELLRFLAAHPGKVFSREALLSQVWGYEYYGGARTVDVHVRRLRSKLGEEHASLIQTVRSVGYKLGQGRW